MLKTLRFLLLYLGMAGCVEPYEFAIHNPTPSLVIEAQISDISFNETLFYPSDGRHFTVKLSLTGDVTNKLPIPVTGAQVELFSSTGEKWIYTEQGKGIFWLDDDEFKAIQGIQYKLRVSLQNDNVFESKWESLPDVVVPPIGAIDFNETEKVFFVMEAGEWVPRAIQGVEANIRVAENNTGEPIHYRWTFSPMWIYKAPLSSVVDPGHICWVTDVNYLNTFEVQTDQRGGYQKNLFFVRTIRNERIFEKFSVLVTQYAMTDDVHDFWSEMRDQNEGSSLIDTPPYNLKTNFFPTSGEKPVVGYFGVVKEQAKRWYFSSTDLSYYVENTLRADCLVDYGGPPAAECFNCVVYSFGTATTTKPNWWAK